MAEFVQPMLIGLLTLLLGIIGWFLRQKDEAQAKQIGMLFSKHDDDAKALAELKERIAREHYVKAELDARFQKLEDAFRDGFHELGAKIDRLADSMTSHLISRERGQ